MNQKDSFKQYEYSTHTSRKIYTNNQMSPGTFDTSPSDHNLAKFNLSTSTPDNHYLNDNVLRHQVLSHQKHQAVGLDSKTESVLNYLAHSYDKEKIIEHILNTCKKIVLKFEHDIELYSQHLISVINDQAKDIDDKRRILLRLNGEEPSDADINALQVSIDSIALQVGHELQWLEDNSAIIRQLLEMRTEKKNVDHHKRKQINRYLYKPQENHVDHVQKLAKSNTKNNPQNENRIEYVPYNRHITDVEDMLMIHKAHRQSTVIDFYAIEYQIEYVQPQHHAVVTHHVPAHQLVHQGHQIIQHVPHHQAQNQHNVVHQGGHHQIHNQHQMMHQGGHHVQQNVAHNNVQNQQKPINLLKNPAPPVNQAPINAQVGVRR